MNAIWSLGQAMFTKCIVVVDEDCDVQDIGEVVLRVTNNIDPERDIQFTLGPVDSLDHSSRMPNYGIEDGDRCDAEVEGGGIRAAMAGDDRDGSGDEGKDRRSLVEARALIVLRFPQENAGLLRSWQRQRLTISCANFPHVSHLSP